STANYLAQHGWQRDAPIAVRAQAAADAQPAPIEGSAPIHTVAGLAARGYTGAAGIAQRTPATLLTLQGRDGPEYWITFTNFQVITRYNTSAMYALAVTQLAADIAQGAATQ
ncbi:MAG: lytic murein transglycosylase, partial [Pseudomonadota bacterium]|nr:lytic murein transglycosylase [Pseudomonadota bacterium]